MMKNLRAYYFLGLLLALSARHGPVARAQVLVNPTAEQLAQIVRSQPAMDLNASVAATATFDPPVVRPGEKAVYRVTFNATAVSVNLPKNIPMPPQLKFEPSANGQVMQSVGGAYQMFATFDYDVRADQAGRFTVPEFTAEVYGKPVVVPGVPLEVSQDLPPHEPVRQLFVEPSATNIFVGEIFDVSVRLSGAANGAIEGMMDMQVNGDGFVVDKNTVRQSFQMSEANGRRMPSFTYTISVTPIASGNLKLAAQGFTAGMQFNGPVVINGQVNIAGGPPKFILLDSEPVTLNVRPLPVEKELPGFTGAVGSYACDPPSLLTNVLKVGEPVQLSVIVRGQKNLNRLNPPVPLRTAGWQLFPAERGGNVGPNIAGVPGVNFKYTLIPLTDSLQATPVIPFSFFDPALGKYVDLTIPALPVTVQQGTAQTNAETALMLTDSPAEADQKLNLTKLATTPGATSGSLVPLQLRGWFPIVQILPALGFCGLWFWDRRRRYLEQHPEIVRRRLARRALRRELRALEQAADRNDGAAFIRRGVSALQIASAPHYPATPRALVSGDVLQILNPAEREGTDGEIVRRFFAAADAAEFANTASGKIDLLAEKPAVIATLQKLEARL